MKLRKEKAYQSIEDIYKVLRAEGLVSLVDGMDYVREYVVALERENFGLRSTNEHLSEKLERQRGYW